MSGGPAHYLRPEFWFDVLAMGARGNLNLSHPYLNNGTEKDALIECIEVAAGQARGASLTASQPGRHHGASANRY
jgi:hypothetical protein